jgi:hypothetical protein
VSDGKIDQFDYSIGASRIDSDNARPNNQYRNTDVIGNVGWSPETAFRVGFLFAYSLSDTGNPNSIFMPRPLDNLLTEKWLIAPRLDLRIGDWWDHHLIVSYDHERQLNDPNETVLPGRPARCLADHDRLSNLRPLSWLTITSGFFYNEATQPAAALRSPVPFQRFHN